MSGVVANIILRRSSCLSDVTNFQTPVSKAQDGHGLQRGEENRHYSAPDSGKSLMSSTLKSSSLCGDSPANPSQFYEVLFLGKIKASHKRAPPSFIDEAIIKFQQREAEKEKERAQLPDPGGQTPDPLSAPARPWEASHPILKVLHSSAHGGPVTVMGEQGCNRTMLLQIGRTDLRLISPDKRQVLLHKSFKEISHCSAGMNSREAFGFICRDQATTGFLGYIFKCSSAGVVEDIMMCLKASFTAAHEATRRESLAKDHVEQCEECPLVWFNSLCCDLEGLPPAKAQSLLLKKIEGLEQSERESILAKMQGAETPDIDEQNQVLMMLLKVSCEVRQEGHKHNSSNTIITLGGLQVAASATPSALQSENVLEVAKRAKRSLADSFNTMVRRKASLDISDTMSFITAKETTVKQASKPPHPLSITNAERRMLEKSSCSPEKHLGSPGLRKKKLLERGSPEKASQFQQLTPDKHNQFHCEVGQSPSNAVRQRARTVSTAGGETMKRELARKKLARLREQESKAAIKEEAEEQPLARTTIFEKMGARSPTHKPPGRQRTSSQRQHIFQQVVTPVKTTKNEAATSRAHRRPKDYKDLWRKAIKQQILLLRMEKENQRIVEHEEQLAERRLKLDYSSLVSSSESTLQTWEGFLNTSATVPDRSSIRGAVGLGIPRSKRGEAWQLMAKMSKTKPPPADKFPSLSMPYSNLKSQLTTHQHAILIDLGRTFPSHPYFSGALGPGQLGLFNMLKAYSLLDPEVGYCQGLPFSCGLLLMHLDEEPAFRLLSHLMLTEGLREMFHPEMGGLQVAMYQLTRLLAETHPSLYRQLDQLEVDPSLYATPWFLTLFAAHFPLGFVARVFDLLFFEGSDAIIKVSICLLVECEDELLACENLEELMNVLKTSLPNLPASKLEDVVKQAASLSIGRQLHTYQVEYQVLQEEEASKKSSAERAKEQSEALAKQVEELRSKVKEGEEREARLQQELEQEKKKAMAAALREEKLQQLLATVKGQLSEESRAEIEAVLQTS